MNREHPTQTERVSPAARLPQVNGPWLRSRVTWAATFAFCLGMACGIGAGVGVGIDGALSARSPVAHTELAPRANVERQAVSWRATTAPSGRDGYVLPPPARPPRAEANALTSSGGPLQHTDESTRGSREHIGRTAFQSTVFVQAGTEYGAGVVLSDAGHVVTCAHVVQNARQLWLVLSDGSRHLARVVEQDEKLDLALVVFVDGLPAHLRKAPMGAVATISVAQEVYGVGAPHKMAFTLNRGIISYVARPFDGVFYLQTDIPTNGGNSGGPVLDAHGQVIGVSTFVLKGSQGLAFALPIDYVIERFGKYIPDASPPPSGFRQWLAEWRGFRGEADDAQPTLASSDTVQ